MSSAKPNFVIFMLDQLAPQFLPAYGHEVVKTPALSAFAQQSVIFDAAYCNSPLCAPSRYVFMSGRLPTAIGAWDNAAEFAAETPTFAHHLSALGYDTTLSGKMHFCGPDQLHGFHRRLTTDVYPADFAWVPDWDEPEKRLDWFHNMDVVRQAGICTRSAYLDYDDDVVFQAKRHLFDLARQREVNRSAQPFCLVVSLISPHDPYLARREHWDRYRHEDIDMPKVRAADVSPDPQSLRLSKGIGMQDPPPSDEEVRNARHAYYGSVSYIDERFADLMQALEESGMAQDTITIVTGDHGDMLGERGLWFKMNWFENSARVPLLVHAPERFKPRRVTAAVSLVDILPTLVDLASGGAVSNPEVRTDGRSLKGHLSGAGGHDEVIGEYTAEGARAPLLMIRRGALKFVHSPHDPDQLYDVGQDPLELRNLAADPAQAQLVDSLRKECAQRWPLEELRERVVLSQRRRRYLNEILRAQNVSWDYQAAPDARHLYIRNTVPIFELEMRSRFPRPK
ncbi:MAG TPA: choline-sulfatase [Steroidobacteraceae bacterium]|jgi:choline-sulfatase